MDWPVPVSMARVLTRVRTRLADDVRDQQEDDLILLGLFVLRAEEVFEEGDLAEAGGAGDSLVVLLGEDAGEDAGLAFLELDDLLDARAGAMMGSVTPEMVTEPFCCGDLDLHLEGDLAVVVDGGRDVDVDADVEVGELGLHADAGDAGGDAGVVGAGGDRESSDRS